MRRIEGLRLLAEKDPEGNQLRFLFDREELEAAIGQAQAERAAALRPAAKVRHELAHEVDWPEDDDDGEEEDADWWWGDGYWNRGWGHASSWSWHDHSWSSWRHDTEDGEGDGWCSTWWRPGVPEPGWPGTPGWGAALGRRQLITFQ